MEDMCPYNTCTQMFINWWTGKQNGGKKWYTLKMKYYVALKRNDVLKHTTTWMNSENVSRERSQSYNATLCMISSRWNVQKRQIYREKSRSVVTKDWRGLRARDWGVIFTEYRVYLGWCKCSKIDCGDNYTTLNILKNQWIVYFK